MHALLIVASLLSGAAPLTQAKDWTAELQAIAKKCGVPEQRLQWVDGAVRWSMPDDSSYDQAKCVLTEIKARGVPMKQGFIATPRDGH